MAERLNDIETLEVWAQEASGAVCPTCGMKTNLGRDLGNAHSCSGSYYFLWCPEHGTFWDEVRHGRCECGYQTYKELT